MTHAHGLAKTLVLSLAAAQLGMWLCDTRLMAQPAQSVTDRSGLAVGPYLRPRSVEEAQERKNSFVEYVRSEGAKVLAVYLPWYGLQEDNWRHWNAVHHNPDGLMSKDIASVEHPLTGLYDSSDEKLIRYHIDLARSVGVDGFIMDWYANTERHDQNVDAMLKVAEEKNFTIALMYEVRLAQGSRQKMKEHLKYILEHYADSPAYQTVGGVPVIYTFGLVSGGFKPEDFTQVQRDLAEEGRKQGKVHVFALVGDSSQQPEYFQAANALYEWINMGAFAYRKDWAQEPQTWERDAQSAAFRASEGRSDRLVLASVYAGFDDKMLGGGSWGTGVHRFLDDQGGAVAKKLTDYAVERNFPWAVVQTFNDWNEGTQFEPSVERGFKRLWDLAALSARMKGAAMNASEVVSLVQEFTEKRLSGKLDSEQKKVFDAAVQSAAQVQEELAAGVKEWKSRRDLYLASNIPAFN